VIVRAFALEFYGMRMSYLKKKKRKNIIILLNRNIVLVEDACFWFYIKSQLLMEI
jgi:hypothetical protein